MQKEEIIKDLEKCFQKFDDLLDDRDMLDPRNGVSVYSKMEDGKNISATDKIEIKQFFSIYSDKKNQIYFWLEQVVQKGKQLLKEMKSSYMKVESPYLTPLIWDVLYSQVNSALNSKIEFSLDQALTILSCHMHLILYMYVDDYEVKPVRDLDRLNSGLVSLAFQRKYVFWVEGIFDEINSGRWTMGGY